MEDFLPGWKTYIGIVAAVIYAASGVIGGYMEPNEAVGIVIAAWTAMGIYLKKK